MGLMGLMGLMGIIWGWAIKWRELRYMYRMTVI